MKQQPWVNSVYPLYLIQLARFDRFQEQLQEHGVRKDTSIVIRAHANAHAEWVEKLMVTLQRHGFQRVSLTLLAEGNTQTVGSTSIRNGSVRSERPNGVRWPKVPQYNFDWYATQRSMKLARRFL